MKRLFAPVLLAAGLLCLSLSLSLRAQPVQSVLPIAPLVSTVTTGGTAVTAFAANTIFNGADIFNPSGASEVLYVDIVTTAVAASGTSIPIPAGQSYHIPCCISTPVSVVAATSAHKFVAVRY